MIINCNCFLIDRSLDEAGVDQQGIPARACFDSEEVICIREVMDGDKIDKDQCCVWFNNGMSLVVDLGYDDAYMQIFSKD